MAYLTPAELSTHLYPEVQQEIERSSVETNKANEAIATAISEAESYLKHYDTVAIFAATGNNRNKAILTFIKDIAVWHFINICNANVEWEMRESRYKLAITFLKNAIDLCNPKKINDRSRE